MTLGNPVATYLDTSDMRDWTVDELDRASGAVAAQLLAEGLIVGDRIALLAANGARFMTLLLGALRVGLVPVPINYRLPKATIATIIEDCAARIVYVDDVCSGLVDDNAFKRSLGSLLLESAAIIGSTDFSPGPEDIAIILYTSGSSGPPKGVPVTHAGLGWAIEKVSKALSASSERTIVAAPTYHMNGLFYSLLSLRGGYRIISMPTFSPAEFLQLTAAHRCTSLSGIPTMFAMMARQTALLSTLDLTAVRDIAIGSAPLTSTLAAKVAEMFPNAKIINSYGTTETGPAMFGPHPDGRPRPALSVGFPYDGVELQLVDGSDPDRGVLMTRTPATLKHYVGANRGLPDALVDGWYRTGDVMCRDAEGFYYFVGRADDMFVCGGENVYPGQVEALLEQHPSVLQAAVVAVQDELKGAIPIAFVVARPHQTIDPEGIRQFALAHGPAYAHPRAVVALDRLPVSGTHKVERSALRPLALAAANELGR